MPPTADALPVHQREPNMPVRDVAQAAVEERNSSLPRRAVVSLRPFPHDPSYLQEIAAECGRLVGQGRQPVLLVPAGVDSHGDAFEALQFAGAEWLVPSELAEVAPYGSWTYIIDDGALIVERGSDRMVLPAPSKQLSSALGVAPRARRSPLTLALVCVICLMAIAVSVGSFVRAPYTVNHPAPSRSIADIVELDKPSPMTGTLEYPVVQEGYVAWSELPYWWLRRNRDSDLIPNDVAEGPADRRDVVPDKVSESRAATAVAATAARIAAGKAPVQVGGDGVQVISAPLFSDLVSGDVIVSADGTPVHTMTDFVAVASRYRPGDRVPVKTAAGKQATVWLGPDPTRNRGWSSVPRMRTLNLTTSVKVPEVDASYVEGGSAGLALALYMYQADSGVDLIRGRHVVATGYMEPNGDVLAVGGVAQKTFTAIADDADIMLVPERNVADAYRFGPYDGTTLIVPVATLQDAIRVLRLPMVTDDATYRKFVREVERRQS